MSNTPDDTSAPESVPFDVDLARVCAAGLRAELALPQRVPPDRLRLALIARLLDDAANEKQRGTVTLSLCDMPELLGKIRAQIATIIRESADDEEPRVAQRLRECADAVEETVTVKHSEPLTPVTREAGLLEPQVVVLAPGQSIRLMWQQPEFLPTIEQLLTGPPVPALAFADGTTTALQHPDETVHYGFPDHIDQQGRGHWIDRKDRQ